ncbi:MAG: hypothetical protein ACRD0C_13350 [Acidimicrobiia bacterium]
MCPTDVVRSAQQLALAIRRADAEEISACQEVLRALEASSRRERSKRPTERVTVPAAA